MIFTPELFPELRRRFETFLTRPGGVENAEFQLPEFVQYLVREKRARVEALQGTGRWCRITFPEDEERAAAMISRLTARGQYPRVLWT